MSAQVEKRCNWISPDSPRETRSPCSSHEMILTVSGRVDGDALYISHANSDGGFTEVRYDRASEDEYEALVAEHARVAHAAMAERKRLGKGTSP